MCDDQHGHMAALLVGLSLSASTWADAPLMRWEPPPWGPLSPTLGLGFQGAPLPESQKVVVKDGHFYTPGPDGAMGTPDDVRMRWFGINIAGVAAFPPEAQAKPLVATLASWGFNAVRIHYIDAPPNPNPAVVSSVLGQGPYPTFNPVAVARLRHLLSELRAHGMYVQLNPIAAYTASPQGDGVPALSGAARLPTNNPLAAIHPELLRRQQRYLTELSAALDLKHQPALAQVDAVNESSLLAAWTHWDPDHWQRTVQGEYALALSQAWQAWALRTHGSAAAARQAWGLQGDQPLPEPTPRHPLPPMGGSRDEGGLGGWLAQWRSHLMQWVHRLPPTWQPTLTAWLSPNAINANTLAHDYLRFLAEQDQRHVQALRTTLRNAIRADLPVAGTQASYGNAWGTVSQAGMDFVDDHFYVDHYQFPGKSWDMTDWYVSRESLSDGGPAWARFQGMASLRDRARPYVIGEFGQPYPNPLGQELVVTLATQARLQDWDGLFLFDHDAHNPARRSPATFDIQGDWSRAVVTALSSHFFRTGSLAALPAPKGTAPDPQAFTEAWLRQRRPDYWTRENAPATPTGMHPEINRLSAQWPGAAWVSGLLPGGSSGDLGGARWHMPLGESAQAATLLAVAMDQRPLAQSRHWLLAATMPTVGSHDTPGPPAPQTWARAPLNTERWTLEPAKGSQAQSAPPITTVPLWTEPARMRVELPARAHTAQIWRLNAVGERTRSVALEPGGDGHWLLPLNPPQAPGQAPTLWFEIQWPESTP